MKKSSKDLVAKRIRTGELAIWDPTTKSVILVAPTGKETTTTARIIKGASFKALQESLGSIIVLG